MPYYLPQACENRRYHLGVGQYFAHHKGCLSFITTAGIDHLLGPSSLSHSHKCFEFLALPPPPSSCSGREYEAPKMTAYSKQWSKETARTRPLSDRVREAFWKPRQPTWRGATKQSVSGKVPPVASWVFVIYHLATTSPMAALRPEGKKSSGSPPLARATKSVGAPGSG